jgi:hypothetical protein
MKPSAGEILAELRFKENLMRPFYSRSQEEVYHCPSRLRNLSPNFGEEIGLYCLQRTPNTAGGCGHMRKEEEEEEKTRRVRRSFKDLGD